ncbi:ECF-type sigma factor [Elongatibacter sediminis]|uniref:ECF-type sigma factor n=1 Tax=Elongatibacter sediminis TaxID=3119006 RepID=A0AAW9RIK4_9GAMM
MNPEHITRLLNRSPDDLTRDEAADMEAIYQRLKKIARIQRVKIRNGQLNTTALVNEAWIKSRGKNGAFADRNHFFAYCALAMRHILFTQARRNKLITYVDDDQALDRHPVYQQSDYLLELERHLASLREFSPRLEQVFTYRFFGEMPFDAIAAVLKMSERTALRDWKKARTMLAVALEK